MRRRILHGGVSHEGWSVGVRGRGEGWSIGVREGVRDGPETSSSRSLSGREGMDKICRGRGTGEIEVR